MLPQVKEESVDAFFAGTGLIDVVIAATVLEWLALELWFGRRGRALVVADLRLNLLSGLCLMLALRSALAQTSVLLVLIMLGAAGLVHYADLRRRWKS